MPTQIVFGKIRSEKKRRGRSLGVTETSEEVGWIETEAEPAFVGTKLGFTKNLENFQSQRVDVEIRIPCNPEDAEEAFVFCKKWCWKKLEDLSTRPKANGDGLAEY